MATDINSFTWNTAANWQLSVENAFGNSANNAGFTPTLFKFGQGSAAGQINFLYLAQGTIAASANLTLDLTSLTDPLSGAIDFANIQAIWFEVFTTTLPSSVTFAATVTDSCFAWAVPIHAGGRLIWLDTASTVGLTVTPSTGNKLKILNNDAGIAAGYRLALAGQ